MLESQRLIQERADLKAEVNKFVEVRGDDPDAMDKMGKRNEQLAKIVALDEKIVEAQQREDRDAQAALASQIDTDGWTAELRDFRELAQRVTISDYIDAAVFNNGEVRGAAREYNEHVFGASKAGSYPIEMLLDRDEKVEYDGHELKTWKHNEERTVITGPTGTHGAPSFVDRILANSEGAFLGARYPTVADGSHSFPIFSGSTVAASYTRAAAETAAGGITINDAVPERVQHSYEIEAGDEARLPGVFGYAARDLRNSLASGIDNKVVDDLVSGLTEVDDNTTLTLLRFMSKFAQSVNGRSARDIRDVRMLCNTVPKAAGNPTIYGLAVGGNISNVGTGFMLLPHDRVRGSAHIAAVDNSDEGRMIAYGSAQGGGIYVPIWRRGQILRDEGRGQLSGLVTITGRAFIDVIVADTSPYILHNIDVA